MMRTSVEWICLGILVVALLVMNRLHLAQAHYNIFMLLFLVFVLGLVLFFKVWHRGSAPDEETQARIR
jgi:hypothetical protein